MEKMLRLREVLAITNLSRSTLYRYIAQGRFPKPKKLNPAFGSKGAARWLSSDIEQWIGTLGETHG